MFLCRSRRHRREIAKSAEAGLLSTELLIAAIGIAGTLAGVWLGAHLNERANKRGELRELIDNAFEELREAEKSFGLLLPLFIQKKGVLEPSMTKPFAALSGAIVPLEHTLQRIVLRAGRASEGVKDIEAALAALKTIQATINDAIFRTAFGGGMDPEWSVTGANLRTASTAFYEARASFDQTASTI